MPFAIACDPHQFHHFLAGHSWGLQGTGLKSRTANTAKTGEGGVLLRVLSIARAGDRRDEALEACDEDGGVARICSSRTLGITPRPTEAGVF